MTWLQLPSAVAFTLGLGLFACGARTQDATVQVDDVFAAPSVSATPTVTASARDAVLDNPALAPDVTSVVQPAYFDAPSAQPDAGFSPWQADADGGMPLNGSGPLTVLLVFDKSSSMLFNWDGHTRWQVANRALRSALDGVLDALTIGVIRFPLGENCAVPEFTDPSQIPFTSGREFVTLWEQLEHRLDSLGTPLGAALGVADRAIARAKADGRLEGRFRVVLVTDGEPNCNDSADAMAHLLASWYAQGIPSLIIGLPGSEAAAQLLDTLAEAGGSGHFTATSTATGLEEILGEAVR